MRFFCDLHIHSRYSRATSSSLTIRELGMAAVRKGITVIGTGDFTHPSWMKEAEEVLVEAEPGLYRLKHEAVQTRFILTSEISTIYKQGDRVRKVHHLLGAPDMETVRKISVSLARVGNILSDGRPILGITSRSLLEIVMEASADAFLIPAHIWTPWFSVLGSKSGFDSIAECYLDLEPHIFAVETGLSSDPPMNWRVRSLDRYHLVSNSDAHSAEKLGREATVFDCEIDYYSMRAAMATGKGLIGTVEFFPEEGKYHLDGHRDCGVVRCPEETRELEGICPVCRKPLTVGVLNRVEELADRPEGEKPGNARAFYSLIPLSEILSEIMQVSGPTKKVMAASERLTSRLAGELPLLMDADPEEIRLVAGDLLALAITRMRAGEVHKEAGFDGKFGRVRVFRDNEQDMLFSQGVFGEAEKKRKAEPARKVTAKEKRRRGLKLSSEQEQAVAWGDGVLVVVAGPGTGKTRVLVERIKTLLDKGEGSILAITFTNRAAHEIIDRLDEGYTDTEMHPFYTWKRAKAPSPNPLPLFNPGIEKYSTSPIPSPPTRGRGQGEGVEPTSVYPPIEVCTFHALAARIMRDAGVVFEVAHEDTILRFAASLPGENTKKSVDDLIYRQSIGASLDADQASLIDAMKALGYYTYEGLIIEATRLLSSGACTGRWDHLMVDEFQDINPVQHTFLKTLSSGAKSVMVIGDPSQAIYGFRGSSPAAFDDFIAEYPSCKAVHLHETYRLSAQVSEASNAFIGRDAVKSTREGMPVSIVRTESPYEFIAHAIESLTGGMSHRGVSKARAEYALSDIAVVVRTIAQASPVMDALGKASIPFDTAYARPLAQVRGIRERIALLVGKEWERYVKGLGELAMERMASGLVPSDNALHIIAGAEALLKGLRGNVAQRIAGIEDSGLFKLPPLDPGHPFYQYARLFGDDTDRFAEFLRLSNDQAALGTEKVHVITAHAAKGLEFPCVFITGLFHGVFPLAGSPPAEEQNLFYVAMTRASDLLTMVCPVNGASEFVSLIPEQYSEVTTMAAKKTKSSQMTLFD